MSTFWLGLTLAVEIILAPFAWRQRVEAARQANAYTGQRNRWSERAR